MFGFCIQVAEYKPDQGRDFIMEQPGRCIILQYTRGALADGFQVHPDGLSRKRTSFILNLVGVAREVCRLR